MTQLKKFLTVQVSLVRSFQIFILYLNLVKMNTVAPRYCWLIISFFKEQSGVDNLFILFNFFPWCLPTLHLGNGYTFFLRV